MTSVNRGALEADLLEWMRADSWIYDPARFERIALGLFAFQYASCPPYTRFCQSLDRTPQSVSRSEDIPAVPTGAFKEFDFRCFTEQETLRTFRTSGTSTTRRGALHLDTLEVYEASLLSSLRNTFLPDLLRQQPTLGFLAPSHSEAPDSSLTHMFETLRRAEGGAASGYFLRGGELDLAALHALINSAQNANTPLVLCGTSFAFVHWLDAVQATRTADGAERWVLPAGSRVLETGGFKGRSREVPRDVLRSEIAHCFELPETHVINQYGMTELGSQFYDSTIIESTRPRRKLIPPWTRVRFLSPDAASDTVQDVDPGEVGLILIHDLANTGSIAALQTADLGRAILDEAGTVIGFDVLGREEGAEARGCSIAADVMLEASRNGGAP